jgi:hypothetical protein
MNWYLDEGLAVFRRQWLAHRPRATVYTIGDGAHSTDPDVSQHAPDRGTSGRPGDTAGEVDAGDVMPGNGVDADDLQDLFEDLVKSRDRRILYVIYDTTIVSSVVSPWKRRPYHGARHAHVHLSVNDNFASQRGPWKIGDDKVLAPRFEFVGKLPTLTVGMEDAAFDGYQAVKRAQLLANWMDASAPDVDVDGVYGPKTAQKIRAVMKTGTGRSIGLPEWRKLLGIYA